MEQVAEDQEAGGGVKAPPPVRTRNAQVTLEDWATGDITFRLGIGQLEEHQELCDAGPFWVLQRLQAGTWFFRDIRETLRLGMIGGGMKPIEALGLVRKYVDARPLEENIWAAVAVLQAVIYGVDDERLGEPSGETTTPTTTPNPSPVENSGSPESMETAP